MKLKDIARLCLKTATIGISKARGTQWLGNGYASYPVFNLPELDIDTAAAVLDIDTAAAVLDIDEEKADMLDVRYVELLPKFDLAEVCEGEEVLTGVVLRFLYNGRQLDAWQTEGKRIVLVDPAYTKPYFADAAEEPALYLRRTLTGTDYIVGKSGMFVTAVIMPFETDAKMADDLSRKFYRLGAAMDTAAAAIPVDPATGEVRAADE